MSTTVHIPMPEWQALAFLRDRRTAFRRLLTRAGNALPCEVVLVDDMLLGFRQRKDCVAFGKRVYPHGYAVLRLVIDKNASTALLDHKAIAMTTDSASQMPLWSLTDRGVEFLSECCETGAAEVLVDAIIGGASGDSCDAHTCNRERHGAGLSSSPPPREPVGPLGFGC